MVGNDSGEVLSIASAVISRLDRNAPVYSGRFSDFNTNYIQASAVAKGGSSGSPVVDIDGNAVALQAGGKANSSATNYFLPLQRVSRALQCLRRGEKITRGTIQTQWKFESFDICRRLGLSPELESDMRKASPGTNTMLVAERVLPNGPADGKLQKGDLLVKVNGDTLMSFIDLDDALDSHVGQSVDLDIRRGDKDIRVSIPITDLHAITPSRFVKVSDAVFHDLSYQMARYFAIPCQGVYLPDRGAFADLPDGAIIDSVNGRLTTDLETFVLAMQDIADHQNVKITYRKVTDPHTKASIFVDCMLSYYPKIESWKRDNDYKRWTLTELDYSTNSPPHRSKVGTFPTINGLANPSAAYIANTIVKVTCIVQTFADGCITRRNSGHGIIVDAQQGIALISRAIVPHSLCSITLNIANVEVSARVEFLHPLHNYALLKYHPDQVEAPVDSVRFSDKPVELNAKVTMVCVHPMSGNRTATETSITDVTSMSIPGNPSRPQYRAINIDAVNVETRLAWENSFGLILGSDGLVQAVWMLFQGPQASKSQPNQTSWTKYGLQAATLKPVVDRIRRGVSGIPRVLDMEMRYYNINIARKHGVAEHWLQDIAKANPRHLVYAVRKLTCHPVAQTGIDGDKLEETDMVLTLNNQLVTNLSAFGELYDTDLIPATIVRGGKEMTVKVPTLSTKHLETTRVVHFCGAVFHQPHLAVRQLMSKLPSEVYVAAKYSGTPAELFKLGLLQFITHVNDVETPNLDTFVREVNEIPDNTFFRLRTVSQTLIPGMVTIKKFDYYVSFRLLWHIHAAC